MHGAPSVSYPVGRCRLAAALQALVGLAGAAAVGAWLAQAPAGSMRPWFGAAALAVAGAAGWHAWRQSPTGLLAWDGTGWRWADGRGEVPGRIAIALDLEGWLLLHWQPEGARGAWLWLERSREPKAWPALRRAVYSPATSGAPGAAPQART